MLTEEEETQLACSMVLIDLLEKNKADGHETEELKVQHSELKAWVEKILATLNEEEKRQAFNRYMKERYSGDIKSLSGKPKV